MSDAAHWLKPVKATAPKGRHVLLYVQENRHKGRVVAGIRRAWCADVADNGWSIDTVGNWTTMDELDAILETVCVPKGETTIWIMRGWTDLVLSGLAELMDSGVITWRYVSLSGRSCLVKGSWRGRKITITALPNWTGNRWDSWGDAANDNAVQRLMTAIPTQLFVDGATSKSDEYGSICQLAAIVSLCCSVGIPRIPPTAGSAGMLLWRTWLGPRAEVELTTKAKGNRKKQTETVTFVAPLPSRSNQAAEAERHVCYPLATTQLRQGKEEGPIYCLDLRSAYLLSLSITPLPMFFDATLNKPKIDELVRKFQGRTGCALVRIQSDDWYYPCRLSGKTVHCRGRFWTWLCGAELINALISDHVAECWSAHLWYAATMPLEDRRLIASLRSSFDAYRMPTVAAAWRSVYSALVGRFAGWERVWIDSPAHAGFGRWSQWLQADHGDGVVIPHRSIAGKVQSLVAKVDRKDSVPLLFGCVTSMVRWMIQALTERAGIDNVVSIAADSLWLTTEGWQKLLKRVSAVGLAPDNLKVKSVYDRAWMSGKNIVVTERNGVRELHMPGVSNGATLDSKGQVTLERTDDWDSDGQPQSSKGIHRRKHRYTASKIVEKYSYPARTQQQGETVSIPLLDQKLLQVLKGDRTVEDA